jgi:hypothetical protein
MFLFGELTPQFGLAFRLRLKISGSLGIIGLFGLRRTLCLVGTFGILCTLRVLGAFLYLGTLRGSEFLRLGCPSRFGLFGALNLSRGGLGLLRCPLLFRGHLRIRGGLRSRSVRGGLCIRGRAHTRRFLLGALGQRTLRGVQDL